MHEQLSIQADQHSGFLPGRLLWPDHADIVSCLSSPTFRVPPYPPLTGKGSAPPAG